MSKGKDDEYHKNLISFAATIDQNNNTKFKIIVAKAEGTVVQLPSRAQMKEIEEKASDLYKSKIEDLKKTDTVQDNRDFNSILKQDTINQIYREEIAAIEKSTKEASHAIDYIKNHYKNLDNQEDFLKLTTSLPPVSRGSGFSIFRLNDSNMAQLVFKLDENADLKEIDNVVYLSINGSDKYLIPFPIYNKVLLTSKFP